MSQTYARQAIETRYHGPTDSRGSRVTARCNAKRITLAWDDALDPFQNHQRAALTLAIDLGWITTGEELIGGSLPGAHTGYAFVLVEKGAVAK